MRRNKILTSTKLIAAGTLVFICVLDAAAQAKVRKLPGSINHPSLNVFAPYVSADGEALVFVSDNAEDRVLTPFYTFRNRGDWQEPKTFHQMIHSRLNFLYGFSLSGDGKTLYYSTLKSPGVGGFDIWTSKWNGSSWSEPENPGMPLNSNGHEACASVTPDGSTMYFMRCQTMNQTSASDCKIFKTTRGSGGRWTEPEELPEHINTGNSQAPRIMADGVTLIFSSDRIPGGKGGMDLYMTRLVNDTWSRPVPLDFVNTPDNDQYVSATAFGRYLLKDAKGERRNEIFEFLFPDELRPTGMMKLEGKIAGPNANAVYISVTDVRTGDRVWNIRPGQDGTFFLFLKEGTVYELAVDPEFDHLTYYVKQFDLTGETIPQLERVGVMIKPLTEGDELPLTGFEFEPYSSDVVYTGSSSEMKRFMRMLNGNPDLGLEVQVLMEGYRQDSVQSDLDLTEVVYDSVHYVYSDIDSLGQLYERDTVVIRTTWHNDRTWQQAEAIVNYLIGKGIDQSRLTYFANAIPATEPGEKKLTIKAVVRRRQQQGDQ